MFQSRNSTFPLDSGPVPMEPGAGEKPMNRSPIVLEDMIVPGCGCASCDMHRSARRLLALQSKFGRRPEPDTWSNS
jgi:hypothetical protein